MRKGISKMQRDRYLKQGGVRCPFCNSEKISGGSMELEAGAAYQDIGCCDCKRIWQDVYTLDGIEA